MNPPLQTPFDLQKYREQYLSYLRLEASNNQKITNAVMLLKTTGQLPVPPLDVRTTTEKLQDLEGSKVQLRALLQEVTDGGIAGQIISLLDSDQITFALQNWETIQKEMRLKYGRGVPLNVFIVYLNKLIDDTQKAEGVKFGLQLATGNNIVLSANQLFGDYDQLLKELGRLLVQANAIMGVDIAQARKVIQDNVQTGLTRADQAKFNALPLDQQTTLYNLMNEYYELSVTSEDLLEIIKRLDKAIRDRDMTTVRDIINKDIIGKLQIDEETMSNRIKIRQLISSGQQALLELPFSEVEIIQQPKPVRTKKEIPREVRESMEGMLTQMELQNALEAGLPTSSIGKPIRTKKPKGPKAPKKIPKEFEIVEEEVEDIGAIGPSSSSSSSVFPKETDFSGLNRLQKIDYLTQRLEQNPGLILGAEGKNYGMNNVTGKYKRIPSSTTVSILLKLYSDYITKSQNKTIGSGLHSKMKGKGLVEKPYRQSIAHLIDTSELDKMERPKMYVPFGRYFVNKHRLNQDGILAFRTPAGNVVPNLSTEKVSSSMANVMKSLIGGGMPEFDNISGLNEDEKDKLFHICKNCKVDTPAVPKSFRKGINEKEEDRFNILRGQIIAGNDSPVIAKEFKIILLKMLNSGRIPKRQANEILQELLILGY
jgi:hypothetical protein